jgi:hypothetical protein
MIIHWDRSCESKVACNEPTIASARRCSALEYIAHRHNDPTRSHCELCFRVATQVAATDPRSDSERYADLRKLVEAYQSAKSYAEAETLLVELRNWSHR